MKPMRLTLFLMLAAVIFCGCDKSSSRAAQPTVPQAPDGETIARFHWLGKKQIAAETNSTGLIRIWNEPESARLETQTLDKLSTAPWRLFPHVATTNTAAAPLLRSLLDDCVQQESYLEIRCATNQPGENAFAIRLDAGRAALWKTNLAAVLESLTGIRTTPTEDGWSLKKHKMPNLIELIRKDEWIVVGVGQEKNALLAGFTARIQRDHAPFAAATTNFWVDAKLDLGRIAGAFAFNWSLPADFPRISMAAIGDGENVRTSAELDFPKSLALTLEPWNLPINIIRGQQSSFTIIRGFGPWLDSQKTWMDLQIGAAPNQFFLWAPQGVPFQTFFSVPVLDASNRLAQLNESLLNKAGPWLTTNRSGYLEPSIEFNGLKWVGLPFLAPYLRADGDFVLGGLFPNAGLKRPLPAELAQALIRTNLVYFDWESTDPRIKAWFYIGQALRVTFHKTQLPEGSVSTSWLQAQSNTLGFCISAVSQSGPNQLSFSRRSKISFSAFELHLLADWLESPQFPYGLNTFLGQRETGETARHSGSPLARPR